MVDLDFKFQINAEELMKDLDQVDQQREQVEENTKRTISFVDRSTRQVYQSVLRMGRASWQIMDTVLSAMGITVDYTFRAIMSAAFGVAQVLIPIFTAESITPGMQVQAALGFLELGMAMAALGQSQQQQAESQQMYSASLSVINSIQMFVGRSHFL